MVDEVFVVVKYDYTAQEEQELSIRKNERLRLVDDTKNWWKVVNENNQIGFVPSNYVRKETLVDKAKGTFKGFGKSRPKLPDFNQSPPQTSGELNGSLGAVKNHNNNVHRVHPTTHHMEARSEATAKYAYDPQRDDELRLAKGDVVSVVDKSSDGWWKGEINGQIGWFPSNYVEETASLPPTVLSSNGYNANGGNSAYPTTNGSSAFNGGYPAAGGYGEVLEVVTALYSFDAQNAEELSFGKGETLDVIEHPPHDPEWWRARNARGETGLVPTNYIEVVQSNPISSAFGTVPPAQASTGGGLAALGAALSGRPPVVQNDFSSPYAHQPWYYGRITRDQSDAELNARGAEGDFLVRDSESNPGDYSISLKGVARNKHFWVQVDKQNGTFKIGNRTFASMEQLIQHYGQSPIFSQADEKLYLIRPLRR
ncbi:Protein NCK-1 a [Aphelenchoides avenae]|nr:Protein NCK-1 a [Aphelenchus avenae]